MPYRNNLGFTPETIDQIIERLRKISQEKLGFSTNSQEEFLGSNMWMVYYAVALMKNQTDLVFEELLDKMFTHFQDIYGSLRQVEGSSSNGLSEIFTNYAKGYEIESYQNNQSLLPGELKIALLEPDLENLQKKIEDYFDFTVQTNTGDPTPSEKITCNVGFPVDFYYTPAKETQLYLSISYKFVTGYVPVGDEKEKILEAFLKKWEQFQILGRDFMPDSYLGNNEEFYYLDNIKVGYNLEPEGKYYYDFRKHEFGEYFTIHKSEDGSPIIEILEQIL